MRTVKLSLTALSLTLALAACGRQPAAVPGAPDAALRGLLLPTCEDPTLPCEDPLPDPDPTPPPAAPTGDRLRVTLVLSQVNANDTEDVTPTWPSSPVDEFYSIGTVYVGAASSGQGHEQGFATNRFSARKGRTYFPNQTVFTAVVNPGTQVASVARAYDEDINKDVNALKAAANLHKAATFACKYLCKDPDKGEVAGWLDTMNKLISGLKLVWDGAITIDGDDNLHERGFDFGTLTQNQSTTLYRTQRYSEGGLGWSTWEYDVTYRLQVEPTNDPLTTF